MHNNGFGALWQKYIDKMANEEQNKRAKRKNVKLKKGSEMFGEEVDKKAMEIF